MGGFELETRRAPDASIRSQPECLQTQIRYQGNFLLQRRHQRITLKSRSAAEQDFQISRMCDISRVEAVSLLKMTIHKQFCCARTVWKDTVTHRAVTYFSQLPARRVIMSAGETTAGRRSKLYGRIWVGNVSCSGCLAYLPGPPSEALALRPSGAPYGTFHRSSKFFEHMEIA